VFTLPEADYYAADGVRLEGHGVSPHVSVPWIDAFIAVADSLRPRYPYAAALLAAQGALSNVTAENRDKRLPLAERFAREALRLAPDSAAPVNALSAALASQRHWAIGLALWDSLLAVSPGHLVVRYQVGRFAALSGERLESGEQSLRAYLAAPRPRNGPTHAFAHWYLGTILEKRGDRSAARREYESGLALEPGNADLKASLARLASSPTP
jgi:tetratricopeptide (TPR) repeat protein